MVKPWSVSLTISHWVEDDEVPANPTDPLRIGQKNLPEETIMLDQANATKKLWIPFHLFTVFLFWGGAEIPLSSKNVGYEDIVRYYYNYINMYVYV